MTGIGISRLKPSRLRDWGKIPVGMAGLKNPIGDPPTGTNCQIWNSSWMPLGVFAMASSTWVTGLPIPGHPELRDWSIQWLELYPTALTFLLWGASVVGKEAPLPLRQPSSSGHLCFGHFPGPLIMHLVCSIFWKQSARPFSGSSTSSLSLAWFQVHHGPLCVSASLALWPSFRRLRSS